MIYPYECLKCQSEFEVIKSYRDIENPENCPDCGNEGERRIARSQSFSGANDWDTAHYNPAMGKVFKNNAEARREAKRRGLEEIGNEPLDKIHKKYDTERDQKAKKSWDDINSNLGEIRSK